MVLNRKRYFKEFRRVLLFVIFLIFLFSSIPVTVAMEKGNNTVNIKGGLMNADLTSVPLATVLKKLNKINKLEYKGDESLLHEKITIQFANLSVEDGLKRILRKFNYTIAYNSAETPASIYIFGKRGENKGNNISGLVDMASLPIDSPVDNTVIQAPSEEQREPRQFTVKTSELSSTLKVIKTPRSSGLNNDAGAPRRH